MRIECINKCGTVRRQPGKQQAFRKYDFVTPEHACKLAFGFIAMITSHFTDEKIGH